MRQVHVYRTCGGWNRSWRAAAYAVWAALVAIPGALYAEAPSPQEVAAEIDRSLNAELQLAGAAFEPAPRCDDATFLHRAMFDLLGRQPTANEITQFALDPAPDKRQRLVQRLLADENFGRNWARYWRDAILYRRIDPRALIVSQPLESYLAEQFNQNTSWKSIAAQMITATGDVRESGATGLIMAQDGRAEETAAEVARLFLGIQIQCAQCHDHPTDRWKREQFHELAAFFPRVLVRTVSDGERRTLEIVSTDTVGPAVGRRGGREHYMPNLDNPSARGRLMTPKFFVTGEPLEMNRGDRYRRAMLAQWITSSDNPWFAKALVNRVWSELVGEGFVEPVDDLGPDRKSVAPATFDLLARQFEVSGYDIKWLFATVMATETYHRESRNRRTADGAPFAANCAQRLRGDQLFTALTDALGMAEEPTAAPRRPGFFGGGGMRAAFNQAFGFDPSASKVDITGSIPQALFMMNSPVVASAIQARGNTALARLLAEVDDDEEAVVELYLRCLARQPTDDELATCLEHVREAGNRGEAFEDLLWALINSTEFLYRR